MPTRYTYSRVLTNDSDYYKPLRAKRSVRKIIQQATPSLRQPTYLQRTQMNTSKHIWKYGDRLYNLSNQFYGDPRYWWVIAWWNGYPTEVSVQTGDFLDIPLDIGAALNALGV